MEIAPKEKAALLSGFGRRLEFLIYRKFRSKEQFLATSGFYKANLHEIINGQTDPQLSTIYRLAKSLDVPIQQLLASEEAETASGDRPNS